MGFTLAGLLLLSVAPSFGWLLVAAVLVGTGSSVFHPESSRVARMASGGRHGLAQSLFQVGGNVGSALGPLLAALFIIPHGQRSVAWFSLAALFGIVVLTGIGRWYSANRARLKPRGDGVTVELPRKRAGRAGGAGRAGVLKYFYLASLNSYFTFYLIDKFGLSTREAQLYLFLFLAAVAVGTVVGGPVGDRIGRKIVIWVSILGVAPFTLMLPHANLFWTAVLVVIIGAVLASAFSAIVVYAQELVPGKVGMIAGLFFGLSFGMGGLGAAALGRLADATSIGYVYQVCAYLPLLGVVAILLPKMGQARLRGVAASGPAAPGPLAISGHAAQLRAGRFDADDLAAVAMMDDGDAGAAQLLQLRGRDGEAARQLGVADGGRPAAAVLAGEAPVVVERPGHQRRAVGQRQRGVAHRVLAVGRNTAHSEVSGRRRPAQDGEDAGAEQIDEGEPASGREQQVEQVAGAGPARGDDHDASLDLMPRSGLVQRARRTCLRSMTLGKLTSVVSRLTIQ